MSKTLALIIVVILLCSAVIITEKYKIEMKNRNVQLAVDYNLFAEYGQLDLVEEFSSTIISSLAVTEKSLADLEREGQISVYKGRQLETLGHFGLDLTDINPDHIYISGPSNILAQIVERLKMLRESSCFKKKEQLIVVKSQADVLSKAIYFDEQALRFIERKDLDFIPRFKASTSYQELGLVLKRIPPSSMIIFSGQEVVGYPNHLDNTAEKMKEEEIKLGVIEPFLAQQLGVKQLAEKMNYQAIRVHSIKQQELEELGVPKAVNRYFKAVQERNVRLLYLKPFSKAENTVQFITALKNKLQGKKYNLELAKLFETVSSNKSLKTIIITLILSLIFLLGFNSDVKIAVGVLSSSLILSLLIYYFAWDLLLLFWALLLAILVPVGEYIYLVSQSRTRKSREIISNFLLMSLISIGTGLVITALLFDSSYLLQIKQFRGIKLAFLAPLVLSVIYYFTSQFKSKYDNLKEILKFLKKPVVWQDILLGSSLLLLTLLYIGRTGNQFWLGISKVEVFFRHWLSEVFIVRPRFKSFLIGHPLLLLGIARGKDKYQQWLLLGGLIGQINIINTLLHLHMPLQISLLRVGLGILLGVSIYLLMIVGNKLLLFDSR